jgi:outer membrane protein TolC
MRAALALAPCLPALASAGLSFDEATRLAREQSPALLAQQTALASVQAAQPAAATLPNPQLSLGIDNLPLGGPDRYSPIRDGGTMQRIGFMQEVTNGAKREARAAGVQARVTRERAMLAVAELAVRRDTAMAWLAVHFAERRADQLSALERENQLLLDTLDSRIAAGKAMPAEHTMARQEALMLADRRDDVKRDVAKARSSLRRFVGLRADDALEGRPPDLAVPAEQLRQDVHRQAEIVPYAAMQAMAQAEVREADAEQRGDWSWEVVYSRRGPAFFDMLSFQFKFELPWQRAQRQQPLVAAKVKDAARIEAERDDMLRRRREELDGQLAELQSLDAQRDRLQGPGLALAGERVTLALASYEAGRGDLAAVLTARREAVEARLRLIDLDAQRSALQVRLTTLIAE